ncbi:MAG: transporter permease [Lachnospiraceae bacterium]|nr:transporter permease [Lachnospiraceae bacterium]
MFFRLYKTRIKCLLKNRETLFWSFGFPILLSIFFYMAFSNLTSEDSIDTIPIAVIQDQNVDPSFMELIESIEITEDKKLFHVRSVSIEMAKKLLNEGKVKGIIDYEEDITLYLKENGIQQSIIKTFVDGYMQKSQTIRNIASLNPEVLSQEFLEEIVQHKDYIENGTMNQKSPDYTLIYFYSLIAMTCMFGCNWGFREMVDIQADQSAIGARINVAPTNKMKLLISNLLAAFTLHFSSIVLLFAFLNNVLRIKFGDDTGLLLLISLIGSLCGISFGAFVCVAFKINVKAREVILTAISIGGGFLAGMMNVEIKYLIATKAPVVGYINPSSLITDALYSLYYYENNSRVYFNLAILSVLTIFFVIVTYCKIRRREYASI